jgi:hypothetical protein
MLYKTIVLLAACWTAIGCTKRNNPRGGESFVSIATVGGLDDETQEVIEKILADEQIECYFDGSVLYELNVKTKDASSAVEVIKKSKELKGKNMEIHPLQKEGESQ